MSRNIVTIKSLCIKKIFIGCFWMLQCKMLEFFEDSARFRRTGEGGGATINKQFVITGKTE